MRTQSALFRVTTACTAFALVLGSVPMAPARAQPAADPGQQVQAEADPPARVGRLARLNGPVSFHASGDTQWSTAERNYPVAAGHSVWAEPNAEAELQFSTSRITLSGGSQLDIVTLDQTGLRGSLPLGKAILTPRDLREGEVWALQTPRGSLTMERAGQIAVTAGNLEAPTVVTVYEGEALITGPGISRVIAAGQSMSLIGTDTITASVTALPQDPFATATIARDRPPLPAPPLPQLQPAPPPPEVASLPGGQELASYGSWSLAPEEGPVWYPNVEPGWVPYRQGHWAFIAPWGWTWIDDAPWGFAPFHYGRWVEVYGRWAWTPGRFHEHRRAYPVYAPALVAFLSVGAGVTIGAAAFASGAIGWVPLGPRETYHPWYPASPRYLGAINAHHMGGSASAPIQGGFRNRGAATMAPEGAMATSRPLRGIAQPVPAAALTGARPFYGQHPVQPSAAHSGAVPANPQPLHAVPRVQGPTAAPAAAMPRVYGPSNGSPGGGGGRFTSMPAGGTRMPGPPPQQAQAAPAVQRPIAQAPAAAQQPHRQAAAPQPRPQYHPAAAPQAAPHSYQAPPVRSQGASSGGGSHQQRYPGMH